MWNVSRGRYSWTVHQVLWGASAGIVIITPKGIWLEHSFRLGFRASNNEAEYEALLVGFRTVLSMGAQDVKIYSDSWLVVN